MTEKWTSPSIVIKMRQEYYLCFRFTAGHVEFPPHVSIKSISLKSSMNFKILLLIYFPLLFFSLFLFFVDSWFKLLFSF